MESGVELDIDHKEWVFGPSLDPNCKIATYNNKCAVVRSFEYSDRIDPRFNLPLELRVQQALNPDKYVKLESVADVNREAVNSDGEFPHVAIDLMPNDPWTEFPLFLASQSTVMIFKRGEIALSRLLPTIKNKKSFISWDELRGSPELIKIVERNMNPEWLLSWLKSSIVTNYLIGCVRGSSASQKRISEGDLRSCPVPKLSSEQAILFGIRALEIRRICKKAEIASQTKLNSAEGRLLKNISLAFKDFLRLPDVDKIDTPKFFICSIEQSLDRLDVQYNTPGHIRLINNLSNCSGLVPLGNIFSISKGKLPGEEITAYIGLEHISPNTGEYTLNICDPDDYGSGFLVQTNSILYGRLRPYLNKVVYFEGLNKGLACSTEIYVGTPVSNPSSSVMKILAAYLRSDYGFYQLKFLPAGGNLPRVSEDYFKLILIPDLGSFGQINDLCKTLDDHYSSFRNEVALNTQIIDHSQEIYSTALSDPWRILDNGIYEKLVLDLKKAVL